MGQAHQNGFLPGEGGKGAKPRLPLCCWKVHPLSFRPTTHLLPEEEQGAIDDQEGGCDEWRGEQERVLRTIDEHQRANKTYFDEGVRLLDLARQAHRLFRKQVAREKRRLLDFVLSNCVWMNGELQVNYRQPFEMLAETARLHRALSTVGASHERLSENWLPGLGSNQRPPD